MKKRLNKWLIQYKGALSVFFIIGTSDKLELCISSILKTCNIVEMVRSVIISLLDSEKTVK